MPYFRISYTQKIPTTVYVFADDADAALAKEQKKTEDLIHEAVYDTPLEVNPSRAVDGALRFMRTLYKDDTEAERDRVAMRDIKAMEGIDVDLAFAYYKARCALNEIVEEAEDESDLIQ